MQTVVYIIIDWVLMRKSIRIEEIAKKKKMENFLPLYDYK